MSDNNVLSCNVDPDDKALDITLRPKRFSDFIGQESIKENLHIYIEASKRRGDVLDHILFSGSQGLGRQRLHKSLPTKSNVDIKATSGLFLINR